VAGEKFIFIKIMENRSTESEPVFIDTKGQDLIDRWRVSGRLYKRKIEPIKHAQKLEAEELVETRLPDGTQESSKLGKPGDWKITGSKGEQFVFSQAKFDSLYEADGQGGYVARERKILALKNPFNKPIRILAPWSTHEEPATQDGSENCMLVVSLDENGELTSDRYIIGDEEMLLSNYEPVEIE